VPYGLYRAHGFVSAPLAKQTGFSEEDLGLFWESLVNMFEHDRSAARGQMATRGLYVFRHDSALGRAPAHKLFDRVSVVPQHNGRAARHFADYAIRVDDGELPAGITLERVVG
jgi:CRISPR-associated protein Csd2